jgi:uncharacterized protein (TIGR03435 family)
MFVAFGFFSTALSQAKDMPSNVAEGQHQFEVASVRMVSTHQTGSTFIGPLGKSKFIARHVTLSVLIGLAFQIDNADISGEPKWLGSQQYDIEAKSFNDIPLTYDDLKPSLQQLLTARFHLKYHFETRHVSGYLLVVDKRGAKLDVTASGASRQYVKPDGMEGTNTSTQVLASMLAHALGEPVIDHSGLKGAYDFKLRFAPLNAADSPEVSIFTAVKEQLGLRLVGKHSVPHRLFVVDKVDEVPVEN